MAARVKSRELKVKHTLKENVFDKSVEKV